MIADALLRLIEGEDLPPELAAGAMHAIMEGEATPAQTGAFLAALRLKGVTSPELAGFARSMREHAVSVQPARENLVDTCGTGGGTLNTFNVSTTAAFVVAGAGVPVAKHGNRAMTSRCGSADVLEALGVKIDLPPEAVQACIEEVGIGFLFAPAHHPAMRHAGPVRKELPFRTVFNLLGPLSNPAGARAQVIGVYDPDLTSLLAAALNELGCDRAFVVHGLDGLDEFSTVGTTRVAEVCDGMVSEYELTPEELDLERARPEDLAGGSNPGENAELTLGVLKGEQGPRRELVLLNAAAGLVAGGAAPVLRGGLALAVESLESGAALAKLEELRAKTQAA